jgi:hypothetical protein
MRYLYLLIICLILPIGAHAEAERAALYTCTYKLVGYEFAKVQIGVLANGELEDYVTVSQQGRAHRESCTPELLKDGEEMHLWISKESKDNSIELFIYREPKRYGKSLMINPHIPMGKEMWGECIVEKSHF